MPTNRVFQPLVWTEKDEESLSENGNDLESCKDRHVIPHRAGYDPEWFDIRYNGDNSDE